MSTEITNMVEKRAIKRLHVYAATRRDTVVPKEMATSFVIGDDRDTYFIRTGQRIWVSNETDNAFYVTLEDQLVQLTFIVMNSTIIVTKKSLPYGGPSRTGPNYTRGVTLSSH